MRHLKPSPSAQRGLTLIELMVGIAIAAFLMLSAAPYFADYMTNSRLREGGNLLYGETLAAQSEAIKRNTTVRLRTQGDSIQVLDMSNSASPVTLRTRTLQGGVTTPSTAVNIDFGSEGRPVNFAAGSINLAISSATCSSDYRCPGLRVDGGGSVRLCANNLQAGC